MSTHKTRGARVMWASQGHSYSTVFCNSEPTGGTNEKLVLLLDLDPASRARYVEAAAKALHKQAYPTGNWGNSTDAVKESFRMASRAALSAVDPRLVKGSK